MNTIKTWQERYNAGNGSLEDCANAEIADLRAALAARATPAQPVTAALAEQVQGQQDWRDLKKKFIPVITSATSLGENMVWNLAHELAVLATAAPSIPQDGQKSEGA